MSPRRSQDRIQDILDAIAEIAVFTQGMQADAFLADAKTLRAVELNFIIIGEAATQVTPDVQAVAPEIPWQLMRGMRNLLVHAYFSVDPQIVWDTIQNDLPQLVEPLTKLVGSLPSE